MVKAEKEDLSGQEDRLLTIGSFRGAIVSETTTTARTTIGDCNQYSLVLINYFSLVINFHVL